MEDRGAGSGGLKGWRRVDHEGSGRRAHSHLALMWAGKGKRQGEGAAFGHLLHALPVSLILTLFSLFCVLLGNAVSCGRAPTCPKCNVTSISQLLPPPPPRTLFSWNGRFKLSSIKTMNLPHVMHFKLRFLHCMFCHAIFRSLSLFIKPP